MPMLDGTAVRDRYQQFSVTARELLADFRQVEENFRKLDRQLPVTPPHPGRCGQRPGAALLRSRTENWPGSPAAPPPKPSQFPGLRGLACNGED